MSKACPRPLLDLAASQAVSWAYNKVVVSLGQCEFLARDYMRNPKMVKVGSYDAKNTLK